VAWKYCTGKKVVEGVLFVEETEELEEGEVCRAPGIAQKECRLDCCPLD
jgi:hypothetical protein